MGHHRTSTIRRNWWRAARAGLAAGVLLVGSGAYGAVAAASVPAPVPVQTTSCVNHLTRIAASGPAARISSVQCYGTFAEAFRAVTNGHVQVSSDLRPSQVTAAMVAPQAAGDSVVLGIDFSDPNFYGDTVYWTASTGCTPSLSWVLSWVGSRNNDVGASAMSFSGCSRYNHYDNVNYGGAVFTCIWSCGSLGALNQRTSSESWDH
jgi:hypothetical protein